MFIFAATQMIKRIGIFYLYKNIANIVYTVYR